jgi:hypothetical protein
MRFKEFYSSLKPFQTTVRLHRQNSVVTTIFFSDSASNLRRMLSELFGKKNVMSVSEIMIESPQTEQIQREQAIRPLVVQRRAQPRKVAQIEPLQVEQQRKRSQRRGLSTRAIADPIKHDLIQDILTKKFMRQSNIIKPTSDDIRIAKSRAETELKKADLDFKKQSDELRRKLEQQRRKNE